jgi:4-oxalocrotonate tautomerase
MPVVTVEWLEGRSQLQKDQLAQAITQALVDVAQVPKDQVWIVFRDVKRSDWSIAGKLLETT